MTDLLVCHLGRVGYRDALELQAGLRARVQAGELGDVLLLLEHPPVYTLGRRSEPGDLPMGESWYLSQGIDVVRTDRGGKLTYHGPGQLVGYPIVHVERIPDHIAAMEGAIVDALEQEGLPGARGRDHEGAEWTGVWIEDRKIASIGVHVSRGVSMHGFAVNVDNDLQPFGWVVACGLPTTQMTSVCKELGRGGRLPCLRKRVAYAFAQRLGKRQRLVTPARLGLQRAVASVG
jgi:lipoyl(octanoyl) transferase